MNPSTSNTIARALISVSDKTGIVAFAQTLVDAGVEILSTGGTARLLGEHGLPVCEVAEHTGFPEIMAGRVKTLHPRIHGGILGRRDTDATTMAEHDIPPIDMVIVNLYPFEETIAQTDCTLDAAIDNLDIGGPALLRAAAKNYHDVCVIADPADYARVQAEMATNAQRVSQPVRLDLAAKAFEHTARYDGIIANYLGTRLQASGDPRFPRTLNLQYEKRYAMRYGENPHQRAAFYGERNAPPASIAAAIQLQGKALSYNNVADSDAALECVKQFARPACVIVKHANPCGAAVADNLTDAYERAYRTDPTSAFGGIIAFNQTLGGPLAETVLQRQFVEVIIAPTVDEDARAVLRQKEGIRVLEYGEGGATTGGLDLKRVHGGLLVQDRDSALVTASGLRVVSKRAPSPQELSDLQFAWRIAKYVKSNAIVYAGAEQTIGVGAGQMSRVYSARIAALKAADEGLRIQGAVMASDAFFPFRDGIDAAFEAGIQAVIQPGGSRRDEEVIAAADDHGLAMVLTGMRHFRH